MATSDMENEIPIINIVNCCFIMLADEEKKNGIESLNNFLITEKGCHLIIRFSFFIRRYKVYKPLIQPLADMMSATIQVSDGAVTNKKMNGKDIILVRTWAIVTDFIFCIPWKYQTGSRIVVIMFE